MRSYIHITPFLVVSELFYYRTLLLHDLEHVHDMSYALDINNLIYENIFVNKQVFVEQEYPK